jgi:hypothetical protein
MLLEKRTFDDRLCSHSADYFTLAALALKGSYISRIQPNEKLRVSQRPGSCLNLSPR